MYKSASAHYDHLIDINNDPVYDSEPLRKYMDEWDGEEFIEQLSINSNDSVLEIGVGTGRIALKVAPFCRSFFGIDISYKTCQRALANLKCLTNVRIECVDIIDFDADGLFDTVYSTLTFMHIENKSVALKKVYDILKPSGRFVLSISKDTSDHLDMTDYKVKLFPDDPEIITEMLNQAGFKIINRFEKERAYIFTCFKQ